MTMNVRIYLDTSTPVCRLTIRTGDASVSSEWEAGRTLAQGLLRYLSDQLAEQGHALGDISSLGVYRGPGSFTGLRIGSTVMNTLADGLQVPIVGETGDAWRDNVDARLDAGEDDRLVMPLYGAEATITHPRK